jgi:hypothetical protein
VIRSPHAINGHRKYQQQHNAVWPKPALNESQVSCWWPTTLLCLNPEYMARQAGKRSQRKDQALLHARSSGGLLAELLGRWAGGPHWFNRALAVLAPVLVERGQHRALALSILVSSCLGQASLLPLPRSAQQPEQQPT